MNLFRIGQILADYTARITCAALLVAAITGYIFTDQHPDLVVQVALYGSLVVLVFYVITVQAMKLYTGSTYRFRDNIITTATICWALPGIVLTPPAHYEIVLWLGITFTVATVVLRPLFQVLADRHDWKHDRDDEDDNDPTHDMPAKELMHND